MVVAAEQPLVDWSWIDRHRDDILDRTWEHITLTGAAVGIGFGIAMVLALVAVRWRWAYGPLAGFCGVLYSIPSLALFGLLVPITGLGTVPAQVALVSYTLLILLRNIVAGIDGVPPPVREAADGMGYRPWTRILRVDLPLAVPAIVAGLRIATVTIVGLVTVTALVGMGGYGALINEGRIRNFPTPIMVGAVLSILMAVVFDLLFLLIQRVAAPWTQRPETMRATTGALGRLGRMWAFGTGGPLRG